MRKRFSPTRRILCLVSLLLTVLTGLAGLAVQSQSASAIVTPDGTLDLTFGTNGRVVTTIGAGDSSATAMVIQPDGKVVTVGYSVNGNNKGEDIAF